MTHGGDGELAAVHVHSNFRKGRSIPQLPSKQPPRFGSFNAISFAILHSTDHDDLLILSGFSTPILSGFGRYIFGGPAYGLISINHPLVYKSTHR